MFDYIMTVSFLVNLKTAEEGLSVGKFLDICDKCDYISKNYTLKN